jgi:hypothetical protein
MVQALQPCRDSPQAIKAPPPLPRVNGPPQFNGLHEIHLLDIPGGLLRRLPCPCRGFCPHTHPAHLVRQPHLRHMPLLAPFHQPQYAARRQPPHRLSRRASRKVDTVRQPRNRKMQPPPPFQLAVSQQMHINHMVDHRKPQLRNHHILHLPPKRPSVDLFSSFSRPASPVGARFIAPFLLLVITPVAARFLGLSLKGSASLLHFSRHTRPVPFTVFHVRRSCRRTALAVPSKIVIPSGVEEPLFRLFVFIFGFGL